MLLVGKTITPSGESCQTLKIISRLFLEAKPSAHFTGSYYYYLFIIPCNVNLKEGIYNKKEFKAGILLNTAWIILWHQDTFVTNG